MNVWHELTKRREGAERFVSAGVVIAIVGAGSWIWSGVTPSDDVAEITRIMGVTWVVVGSLFAGVTLLVIAQRKRDEADS